MNNQLDHLYIWTSDSLRLQGDYYEQKSLDENSVCVLVVHGMAGNIIENYFIDVLGKTLSVNEIGCLYGHNRGYNYINDIPTSEIKEDGGYKTIRIGTTYERFNESLNDIDAWLDKCRRLGYKKIVLMGHSLGCNKVIHYFHEKKPSDVIGIILASPPDMVGLAKLTRYQPNYEQMLSEAKKNIEEENPRKLLSSLLWDSYQISSQTFLDLFEDNCPADIFPVLRNPDSFKELELVNIPILGIMGENDDIEIKNLQEDFDLISKKAKASSSFTKTFIPKANHTYDQQEQIFAEVVLEWIKMQFKS